MPFSLYLRSPSPFTLSLRLKDEMDGGVAEDIVVLVEHCLPALLERGRSRGGASPLIMMIVSGGGSDLSASSSRANSCQRSSPHPAPSFFPRGFPCMGERRTEFRFQYTVSSLVHGFGVRSHNMAQYLQGQMV